MANTHSELLQKIQAAQVDLHGRFSDKLKINRDLDRSLVSFQANKSRNGHRWYKYKEGFSSDLIRYVVGGLGVSSGPVLDPFAGSGAALFTGSELGLDVVGIELLASSAEIIEVREILRRAEPKRMAEAIGRFRESVVWETPGECRAFPHLRITAGAFPVATEMELGRYLYEVDHVNDVDLERVLCFAAMCVLEDVSYTRKDGQYLRWDHRSGRGMGKKAFDKGTVKTFTAAICSKLDQIAGDICENQLSFADVLGGGKRGHVQLLRGSCLEILPTLDSQSFNGIITSPPYCNRYDYTRTYALELAMMGIGEGELRALRQAMLSCTVENREKENLGHALDPVRLSHALRAFESQELLRVILEYLDACKTEGLLNNPGIPRMVRNYFKELGVVVFECARLLQPGAYFVMVNDNVRYQGVDIPVDLILSEIAVAAGLDVEAIWVLPIGKGNSSQQMQRHGRAELRKCVYVWRRQKDTSQAAKSESC